MDRMDIAFFDTKSYDRHWFDKLSNNYRIVYHETRLTQETYPLAQGCRGVIAFVNDEINEKVIKGLSDLGVEVLALRCAGYNNVDIRAAEGKLAIYRVPSYSPHAVAEHAMALLLSLDRKIHKAYNRTRDFNFSLNGLCGFDLFGKTAGVIGTGKIGRVFAEICEGFGMNVLAYDVYPDYKTGLLYTELDRVLAESHVISLHCPLNEKTFHLLNRKAFSKMREDVIIINTSRGGLIDSEALLEAIGEGKVAGAGLDVYEEENGVFFEDRSQTGVSDEVFTLLTVHPNVIVTSHQAFLTQEALYNIAKTTFENLDSFFSGTENKNRISYKQELQYS